MNCRFCGKSFNRGFNLRGHGSEYCPYHPHQSVGISTKRKYADTDDSTSESDLDHSDYTDDDPESEHEIDPWASLKIEAIKKMLEFEERAETFTADGLEEEAAREKAYLTTLPKLRKNLQGIYLDRLLWIAQMKKDPIHRQIKKTKDAFVKDDNFDRDEISVALRRHTLY